MSIISIIKPAQPTDLIKFLQSYKKSNLHHHEHHIQENSKPAEQTDLIKFI